MNRSTPGLPVHHQLPEFTQTHVHWVGDVIQPSHPLLSPSPPAPNPSQHQGVFQWINSSHEVAKVLEFQCQHQSFQWTSGLVSFRIDWLDLLAVQGTLKSLFQHHSSKASILRHSAFFTVQLSHPYMTTGKSIALKRWTFVGKIMSLLFNMLSKLVITFLPRSQFSLVAQSYPTLCHPMNRSTPGLPVHHQLLEFTQTHIHWVSDAIQLSHPLSSPSPPAPNPSQHQSLFQWVITSWQIDGETVAGFIFLGSKITADGDCRHEIKKRLLLGRKVWPT